MNQHGSWGEGERGGFGGESASTRRGRDDALDKAAVRHGASVVAVTTSVRVRGAIPGHTDQHRRVCTKKRIVC